MLIGNIMVISTLIYTFFNGVWVGKDQFGNNYYRSKSKQLNGRERRWVLYKGRPEASLVPPEWNSWLHHTTPEPLIEMAVQQLDWQLEHVSNMTGTSNAYRPVGHAYKTGERAETSGDYTPWTPE